MIQLLKKELRAQLWLLLGLTASTVFWLSLKGIADRSSAQQMSPLELLRFQLLLMTPLAAHLFAQRALVSELREKTILFLEALPISRLSLGLGKVAVVILGVGLVTLLPSAWLVYQTAQREALASQTLLYLGLRILVWSFAVTGVTVLGGVLGRYRIPLYLLLLIFVMLEEMGGGTSKNWGPLPLAQELVTHRAEFPSHGLAFALVLGGLGFALASVLWFFKQGAWALRLGDKMTHTERSLTAGFLLAITFLGAAWVEPKYKPPFRLTEAQKTFSGNQLAIFVTPAVGAEVLGRSLLGPLDRAVVYLQLRHIPVYIVHRADFDERRIEPVTLDDTGVMFRVNVERLAEPDDLAAVILAGLADEHSLNRSRYEPHMWVRDGFGYYWPQAFARTATTTDPAVVQARQAQLELRAAYVVAQGWQWEDLDRWHTVRDTYSEPLAGAVAWSILQTVAEAEGPQVVLQLAQETFAKNAPHNILVLGPTYRQSGLERLTALTGASADALHARWRQKMADIQRSHAQTLEKLPHFSVQVKTATTGLSRWLDYRVGTDRTPAPWVTAQFGVLSPQVTYFDRLWATHQTHQADDQWHRLPRTFSPQTRVYFALNVYLAPLGCEVLVAAQRRRLP